MSITRVLIVDADQRFAFWLAQELVSWGFECHPTHDNMTAIQAAASLKPDVMLIDAFLPGPGGPAVVEQIRHHVPNIGVLFTTNDAMMAAVAFETVVGIDDFIIKTPNIREFAERLRRVYLKSVRLSEIVNDLQRRARGFGAIDKPRRKRISVLFSDVRGFTSFSESRDPETVAGGLNTLFEVQATSVQRFGGHVDKFIGDGMMALFGLEEVDHSRASEHALAAVFASQEIVEEVAETETMMLLTGSKMNLGIGLHRGEAVVGPIGPSFQRDYTAIGDTVNLASRLCAEAGPGEIVVSEAFYSEVHSSVELLWERKIRPKGKREVQRVFSIRLASSRG